MKKIKIIFFLLFFSRCCYSATDPFPGNYSVTIKGLLPSGIHFTKLAKYSFQPDGTLREDFWIWYSNTLSTRTNEKSLKKINKDRTQYGDTSKKVGYVFQNTYPYNFDEDFYVQGLKNFDEQNPSITTLFGEWIRTGQEVRINWSWGDWEDWLITWSDQALYKIELYNSNYTVGDYYLQKDSNKWKRNSKTAVNSGWGFGAAGFGFNYGSTVLEALKKNYSGRQLQFNSWICSNIQVNYDELNLNSYFLLTNNNVARFVYWDSMPDSSSWVFHYYSKPEFNPDLFERRIFYQVSHDSNNNGRISEQNDIGHTYAGLEILDTTGKIRGMVFSESSINDNGTCKDNPNTLSSIFYIDSDFCNFKDSNFIEPCN